MEKELSFVEILKEVAKGDLGYVQKLLSEQPHLLNQRTGGHNRTMLWEAVNSKKLELVTFLISKGANVNIPGRYRNQTMLLLKPYCIATKKRDKAMAKLLLENGHEMDTYSTCFLGLDDDLMKMLRYDPTCPNKILDEDEIWNCTPLHYGTLGGHETIIGKLIAYGAEVTPHSSLLYEIACRKNDFKLIKYLTEHGADPTMVSVPSVLYPNNDELSDYFFNKGLNPNKVGWKEWPPIAYLSRGDKGEHPGRIKQLIKHGAELNAQNPKGVSALHAAAKAGYLNVLRVLIDAGADLAIQDNSGNTPLDLSIKFNREEATALLLKHTT